MKGISTLSLALALSACALAALGNVDHAHDLNKRAEPTVYSYAPLAMSNPTPIPKIGKRAGHLHGKESDAANASSKAKGRAKKRNVISNPNGVTRKSFNGEAKLFTQATGVCNMGTFGDNDLVVALNREQYGGLEISKYCGQCVEVTGDIGTLVLKVVDKCTECGYGNLGIASETFKQISSDANGVGNITWKFTTC